MSAAGCGKLVLLDLFVFVHTVISPLQSLIELKIPLNAFKFEGFQRLVLAAPSHTIGCAFAFLCCCCYVTCRNPLMSTRDFQAGDVDDGMADSASESFEARPMPGALPVSIRLRLRMGDRLFRCICAASPGDYGRCRAAGVACLQGGPWQRLRWWRCRRMLQQFQTAVQAPPRSVRVRSAALAFSPFPVSANR